MSERRDELYWDGNRGHNGPCNIRYIAEFETVEIVAYGVEPVFSWRVEANGGLVAGGVAALPRLAKEAAASAFRADFKLRFERGQIR